MIHVKGLMIDPGSQTQIAVYRRRGDPPDDSERTKERSVSPRPSRRRRVLARHWRSVCGSWRHQGTDGSAPPLRWTCPVPRRSGYRSDLRPLRTHRRSEDPFGPGMWRRPMPGSVLRGSRAAFSGV